MGFTNRELKAVGYAAKLRGWRPTLSYKPWVYFHTGILGDDVTERLHITDVLSEYDSHMRQESRNRQRMRTRQMQRGML